MANKRIVTELIKQARQKGLVTKYKDFCKTDLAKETALTDEEVKYYTTKNEEYNMYKSLEQSLKEMKLIKQGKVKTKSWRELLEEIEKDIEPSEDDKTLKLTQYGKEFVEKYIEKKEVV